MRTHYLGQESLPVTHIFTQEEMDQFALEMASQLGEAEKLEMQKKQAMDVVSGAKRTSGVETFNPVHSLGWSLCVR